MQSSEAESGTGPSRLRDLVAPTVSDQALLRALSRLEPHRPSSFAKKRVRARIAATPLRPRHLKRVAFALMFLGGTASALVGSGILENAQDAQAAGTASEVELAVAPDPRAAGPSVTQVEVAPLPDLPVEQARPAPIPQKAPSRKLAHKMAEGEDPTRVVEALQALRKEGDPDRAQKLLKRYMDDNPKGALSEEALALSIEAAHAKGDRRARSHAKRYLAKFPNGRHSALARRVLAR